MGILSINYVVNLKKHYFWSKQRTHPLPTVNIMYVYRFGYKQYDFYARFIVCPSAVGVGIIVCLYGCVPFQILFNS